MIFLGSKSPRRKELLAQMGYDFEVLAIEVDESFDAAMNPREVPAFIAEKKANAMRAHVNANDILICADTIVLLANEILEKPKDEEAAKSMLRKLSGKSHEVLTGVVVIKDEVKFVDTETTKVYFKDLSEEEIAYYVSNYKPFDKAGSYGIQEWIGAIGIAKIEGAYNNVVGLPTHMVYEMMKQLSK